MDPEIYPKPEIYDPNRFSPEETEKRHFSSFLPFGLGPRMCIGNRFALILVKVALVKILVNFELKLDQSKTPVPLIFSPSKQLLSPDKGVVVNFKKI